MGRAACLTPQLFLPVYLHTNVGLLAPPATVLPDLPAVASPGLPAAVLPTPVLQLPPCCESCPPWLPVSAHLTGLGISSLTSWLSDFIQFDFLAGLVFWLFFVFRFVVVFFWLCKEAQCMYASRFPSRQNF